MANGGTKKRRPVFLRHREQGEFRVKVDEALDNDFH